MIINGFCFALFADMSNEWHPNLCLVINADSISLVDSRTITHNGNGYGNRIGAGNVNNTAWSYSLAFDEIKDWNTNDESKTLEVLPIEGSSNLPLLLEFQFIRDVKHTLEYFWNNNCILHDRPAKLGSTHGRPAVSVTTLMGEAAPGDRLTGIHTVLEQI